MCVRVCNVGRNPNEGTPDVGPMRPERTKLKNIDWIAYETVHKKYLSIGEFARNRVFPYIYTFQSELQFAAHDYILRGSKRVRSFVPIEMKKDSSLLRVKISRYQESSRFFHSTNGYVLRELLCTRRFEILTKRISLP